MSTFHFQRFSVVQNDSAMKVCTDATLFGAMAPVMGGQRVLDIGTGTGLLALMAAQLGAASITAVEVTTEAHREAAINFNSSPWSGHLQAVHQDIQGYSRGNHRPFDLIICNPPFFQDHLKSTSPLRLTARHSDQLPFPELLLAVDHLLSSDGQFYLLLPNHAVERFCLMAAAEKIHLVERTDYRGYRHNCPKVTALTFRRRPRPFVSRLLTIYRAERLYSDESQHYLVDFLLRFREVSKTRDRLPDAGGTAEK